MLFSHIPPSLSSATEAVEPGAVLQDFLDIFRNMADPRDPRGLRHEFVFILAATTIVTLAGAKSCREIADHIDDLPVSLLKVLGARWNWFHQKHACPSVSAIRALFAQIDIEELERRIGAWLFARAHRHQSGQLVLALDGKVLRGAWLDDHQQFTLFSAMIHGLGVTVGQLRVPVGTTEVTQVNPLMDMIPDLEAGILFTVDAVHTLAATATAIKKNPNNDFIMTVKSNQPTLLAELITRFRAVVTGEPEHVVEESGHGRKKRWSIWTLPATGIDFPHLEQIGCIRRDTWGLDGVYIGKEFAFPITSATREAVPPAELNRHVRNHWGIEAKSHWVRDTVWQEDHNQSWAGNTAHVLAAFRNLALGILHLAGEHHVKRATERIARDRLRAIPIIAAL